MISQGAGGYLPSVRSRRIGVLSLKILTENEAGCFVESRVCDDCRGDGFGLCRECGGEIDYDIERASCSGGVIC